MGFSNAWTRLKKTRGQVLVTPDRADPPSAFTHRKEGQVKPMASLYAFNGGLAVTATAQNVTFPTVLVVAQ